MGLFRVKKDDQPIPSFLPSGRSARKPSTLQLRQTQAKSKSYRTVKAFTPRFARRKQLNPEDSTVVPRTKVSDTPCQLFIH